MALRSTYWSSQFTGAGQVDQYYDFDGYKYKLASQSKIDPTDPNLPSYQDSNYQGAIDDLNLVQDCYEGKSAWVGDPTKSNCYLPKFSKEDSSDYQIRLQISLFRKFFAQSVKGFPGFLADIQGITTLYPDLVANIADIDLQGNNLISFLWQADLKVIRDGSCGILIDMPRSPRDENGRKIIKTLADQRQFKSRPYLVLVDRRDILSSEVEFVNGRMVITRITIRENVRQPLGQYGSQTVTQYKTFFNDGSYRIEILIEDDNDVKPLVIEEGKTDLGECPLVLYSATDINPLEAEPPLLNLAETNIAYYQLWSEYRSIIQKMNVPVPVRVGLMLPGSYDQDLPPMIMGRGIDVPQGGNFFFAELKGSVLATDRSELADLEVAMNTESLKFLVGGERNRTATEVALSSTQVKANLNGMATLKDNVIQSLSEKWGRFYNSPGWVGEAQVNRDLLKIPMDAQTISSLSQMAVNNQISILTLLETLKDGKALPDRVDPWEEIERIKDQLNPQSQAPDDAPDKETTNGELENDDDSTIEDSENSG